MYSEVAKYSKRCSICKLCLANPEIDRLLHQDLFEQKLTLGAVVKKLNQLGHGVDTPNISNHFKRHLLPAFKIKYNNRFDDKDKNGSPAEEPKEEVGGKDELEPTKMLRSVITDLKLKYDRFAAENKDITQANLGFYNEMTAMLQKAVVDFNKIEHDQGRTRVIVLEAFNAVLQSMLTDMIDIATSSGIDESKFAYLKNKLKKNVEKSVEQLKKLLLKV